MRIVYIITVAEPVGGAQVHVRDLSLGLSQKGHKITVLVGNQGIFTEQLEDLGITYRIVPGLQRAINPVKDLLAFVGLRRIIKEITPDLVAAHSSKAGWLGRLVARSLGIPAVFTAHGWAFTDGVPRLKQIVYAWAERLAAPLASHIITVSEFDRYLGLKHRIAPAQKIIAVQNGVYDIAETKWAQAGVNPPRLVMVARFSLQKDHATLFRALARLSETSWQLDLVGSGPLLQQAQEMVDNLRLAGKVNFLGERADVAELLARSQIFVLISNWEGFPLSILEAMRAKLPVVASSVGGVNEIVEDGNTGFLIERGDHVGLADRLAYLINQPELRKSMGERGRQRFLENFTVQQMLRKTLSVYDEVLKKH